MSPDHRADSKGNELQTGDPTEVDAQLDPPSAAIVLAAGEGTRMKSALPKVMHPLAGRTLLAHALGAVEYVNAERVVVVVRHERDRVAAHAADLAPSAIIADQDDIPGTGRAVVCGLDALRAAGSEPTGTESTGPELTGPELTGPELTGPELTGTVLVTYGDVPMLTGQTLADLLTVHRADGNAVTVLTARVPEPAGYGRIVRAADGTVAAIVEHKDASADELAIDEINSGLYAFDAAILTNALARVGSANAQGEVYLTDVLAIARGDGHRVAAHLIADHWQTEGVNDRVQLASMGAELNRRTIARHLRAGVSIIDPATTWVDAGVTIEQDVTLAPGTQLHGATHVETGATIGPDTTLRDCQVGANASVLRSHGSGAVVGPGATVGPFSYLRPGTNLGADGKIGAFVETKNVTIGDGSKVPHLSYVGDATIGVGVNIGAATVFVNYDGVEKHHTTVGDHARVGSDTMLVAPVQIGAGAYTAAGSVITDDVPHGAIAVARGKQRNIRGWVARRRAGSAAANAAQAADSTDDQATPGVSDSEGTSR